LAGHAGEGEGMAAGRSENRSGKNCAVMCGRGATRRATAPPADPGKKRED
jgi:hypothetical protein